MSRNGMHVPGLSLSWIRPWMLTVVIVVVGLAALQLAVGPILDSLWFARPTDVFAVLVDWFSTGSVFPHIATTVTELVIGFAIGIAIAIVLAILCDISPTAARIGQPFLYFAYSLPKVALVPIFILIFGVGLESKIAQVTLNVVFIVFLSIQAGLASLNERLRDVLVLMGATPAEIMWKVKAPSSVAWLLAGMRISSRYALGGAVVAELLSSNRGLGFLVAKATALLEPAELFASLTLLTILGLVLMLGLQYLEYRVLRWRF